MAPRATETAYWLARVDGALDAHGNPVESYAAPVPVPGISFDPGGAMGVGDAAEPRMSGHDRVVTAPTIYGPYDMPFRPQDQVIVRGVTYEAVGEVLRWRSPYSGRKRGAVQSLKRVTG